ncbi:hypothetical protein EKO04_007930 [Ascochyta lentis]|uniref:Uncharacterized protein n=1 Tax=Ascochyta lentis TaxID=205686 RepID=A0A8H7MGM4_9PLEO|nr:hypothetical protein EKO04_007930 [Ascochyta lentis]
MMAGQVDLSPSQVRQDEHWWLIRHKTAPNHSPSPSLSIPRRLSSVTLKLRRKPLPTINEDQVPSLKTDSSDSLKLTPALSHQTSTWAYCSERLIYICPSRQLQELQSVSYCSADEDDEVDKTYWPTWRVYRMQSEWPASPDFYVPSGAPETEESAAVEKIVASVPDTEDVLETGDQLVTVEEDLPREAIADLFYRVEEYEREHPDNNKDAGKVWVRVSEVGQGLTKTLKTVGSLRRKQTFQARLKLDPTDKPTTSSGIVPVRPQVKIYEKPTRIKRLSITVGDCWKRLRNWSRDMGTDSQANHNVMNHPVANVSVVSFGADESFTTRPQTQRNGPPRAPAFMGRSGGTVLRPAKKDTKHSVSEKMRKRKSSLFLDVD